MATVSIVITLSAVMLTEWLAGLRSARCQVVAGDAIGEGIALPAEVLKKNGWRADQKVVLTRIE